MKGLNLGSGSPRRPHSPSTDGPLTRPYGAPREDDSVQTRLALIWLHPRPELDRSSVRSAHVSEFPSLLALVKLRARDGAVFRKHPLERGKHSAEIGFAVVGRWIPERSATSLREADLDVLSKLGKQGLEWRFEPEAFAGREVCREDDLLDVLVGCPIDIQVAWQPST